MQILGEEYNLLFKNESEDARLQDKYGYTDWTNKTIVIQKDLPNDGDSLSDLEQFKKKVIRHEIVHAFFNESGLMECSEYAWNEELIDWIAVQIPKIVNIMQSVDVL